MWELDGPVTPHPDNERTSSRPSPTVEQVRWRHWCLAHRVVTAEEAANEVVVVAGLTAQQKGAPIGPAARNGMHGARWTKWNSRKAVAHVRASGVTEFSRGYRGGTLTFSRPDRVRMEGDERPIVFRRVVYRKQDTRWWARTPIGVTSQGDIFPH